MHHYFPRSEVAFVFFLLGRNKTVSVLLFPWLTMSTRRLHHFWRNNAKYTTGVGGKQIPLGAKNTELANFLTKNAWHYKFSPTIFSVVPLWFPFGGLSAFGVFECGNLKLSGGHVRPQLPCVSSPQICPWLVVKVSSPTEVVMCLPL